jgi:hypothetical protein
MVMGYHQIEMADGDSSLTAFSTKDLPLASASRTLNKAETNYSTTEKELLTIVWGMRYFRPYRFGRKFIVVTDHKPLTSIMSLKDPGSRLLRWRIKLEEYDYDILYKKGGGKTPVPTR